LKTLGQCVLQDAGYAICDLGGRDLEDADPH
jgi:hypothetical protein